MRDRISRLQDEIARKSSGPSGLDSISQVAAILEAIPDRTAFLSAILKVAQRCFMSDREAILSYHAPTRRWFVEASQDMKTDAIEEINGLSRTVIDRTREAAESILISDTSSDDLTRDSRSVRLFNIQSVLTAPIQMGEELWGMIYLANTCIPGAFDADSQNQIKTFASFVGIAIKRCDEFIGLNLPPLTRTDGPTALLEDVRSPRMIRVIKDIKQAAPTDASILLLGETGTGKNVIAKWIHAHSPRREKPFVEINCAELDTNLAGVELFGVETGVATGVVFREGKIKVAEGGTVFINEIGELPLSVQAKLLRVVEEKIVERVGGRTVLGVDVRFICATHRDLPALVESGQFRRDLYHRIGVFEVTVPPLRERAEDLPSLVSELLVDVCRKFSRPTMQVSKATLAELAARDWNGNIRELAYAIERAVIRTEGNELEFGDQERTAPSSQGSAIKGESLNDALDAFEAAHVRRALQKHGWVQSRAAKQLAIPLSTLHSKMKKHGIKPPPRVE